MFNISHSTRYSPTEVLSWVQVPLYSFARSSFWHFFYHIFPDSMSAEQSMKLGQLIKTSYIFPLVELQDYMGKLLVPPKSFKLAGKSIYSLDPDIAWRSINSVQYVKHPTPCNRCGWYCLQTCQLLS